MTNTDRADLFRVQLPIIAEAAANMAKIAKVYFDALLAEGFTEPQALALSIGLLSQSGKKP